MAEAGRFRAWNSGVEVRDARACARPGVWWRGRARKWVRLGFFPLVVLFLLVDGGGFRICGGNGSIGVLVVVVVVVSGGNGTPPAGEYGTGEEVMVRAAVRESKRRRWGLLMYDTYLDK